MTLCTLYALAAIIAFVVGAPLALLAPGLMPAVVSMPDAHEPVSPVAVQVAETRGCDFFVAVYAARGQNRPVVVACPSATTLPAPSPLTRAGKPLAGAAKAAHEAKAKRASAGECAYTGQASSKAGPCRKATAGKATAGVFTEEGVVL